MDTQLLYTLSGSCGALFGEKCGAFQGYETIPLWNAGRQDDRKGFASHGRQEVRRYRFIAYARSRWFTPSRKRSSALPGGLTCARQRQYHHSMITRLYANNFRCLVAFKAEFDSFGVLCGPNGAGKSSVFDAIGLIRTLGTGDGVLGGTGDQDVKRLELTNWLDSKVQEFELGL